MKDILFFLVLGLGMYIFSRIMLKQPILFWKEKKHPTNEVVSFKANNKGKAGSTNPLDEEEAAPFHELFPNIKEISNHMIRHHDNTFSMMAEVEPVNYFLLDQDEQEAIDSIYETWTAQIAGGAREYLQNRFVDLTEPIEEIQRTMEQEEDLHPMAYEFGQNMIRDLREWQAAQPRYETKRYLIFDYKVDPSEIRANDSEELEEKIVDKAFNELNRRISTAKNQLKKANMYVHMLTTDGISEVLYYAFNRRKAVKNRYRDVEEKEQLAIYVTADQSASHILRVKGEMERVQKEEQAS